MCLFKCLFTINLGVGSLEQWVPPKPFCSNRDTVSTGLMPAGERELSLEIYRNELGRGISEPSKLSCPAALSVDKSDGSTTGWCMVRGFREPCLTGNFSYRKTWIKWRCSQITPNLPLVFFPPIFFNESYVSALTNTNVDIIVLSMLKDWLQAF